jgi:hypothetical protein
VGCSAAAQASGTEGYTDWAQDSGYARLLALLSSHNVVRVGIEPDSGHPAGLIWTNGVLVR